MGVVSEWAAFLFVLKWWSGGGMWVWAGAMVADLGCFGVSSVGFIYFVPAGELASVCVCIGFNSRLVGARVFLFGNFNKVFLILYVLSVCKKVSGISLSLSGLCGILQVVLAPAPIARRSSCVVLLVSIPLPLSLCGGSSVLAMVLSLIINDLGLLCWSWCGPCVVHVLLSMWIVFHHFRCYLCLLEWMGVRFSRC
jgi:hypothetical protein